MARHALQWQQFRRLLLGTVIEALLDARVALDFSSIQIDFHDESAFKVPRLDNYMRFKGELVGLMDGPLPDATRTGLQQEMRRAWHELLEAVDLPMGDRLTSEQERVEVGTTPEGGRHRLRVAFDLEAD